MSGPGPAGTGASGSYNAQPATTPGATATGASQPLSNQNLNQIVSCYEMGFFSLWFCVSFSNVEGGGGASCLSEYRCRCWPHPEQRRNTR
jgi:hypothetical protein